LDELCGADLRSFGSFLRTRNCAAFPPCGNVYPDFTQESRCGAVMALRQGLLPFGNVAQVEAGEEGIDVG